MEIRMPGKEEMYEITDIHLKAFKGFFLSELGRDFLSTYYNALLNNDRGILLGCYENDQLLGFCAATTLSNGFNKFLVKSSFISFAKIGLLLLFTKPRAIVRLLKNFTKSDSSVDYRGNYAELLSIGVSPAAQGKGAGKKLLFFLEDYLKEKNISELSLTTDYHNNEKTQNFYKGMGYKIMYDFVAYPDRRMYRLSKKI